MYAWLIWISWRGQKWCETANHQDPTAACSIVRMKYPGCIVVSYSAA